MKRLITTCLVAAVCSSLAPVTVLAQVATCNANISAEPLGVEPYAIGEPVPIQLTMGADTIDGGSYLDIDKFAVYLDCTVGDIWPNCTVAGNTVTFDQGSVMTTCTDGQVVPMTSTFTYDIDTGLAEVVFLPDPDPAGVIRIQENTSCTVDFDVTVDAVNNDNQQFDIVQLLGWAEADGNCEGGGTVGESTPLSFNLSTLQTRFIVNKDFSDDNPQDVTVELTCNTGYPLQQDFEISDSTNGSVTFVVGAFEPGVMDCWVTEDAVAGYSTEFAADTVDGIASDIQSLETECRYEGVESGTFVCDVTNILEPVTWTLNKQWFVEDAIPVEEQWFELFAECENYREGPFDAPGYVEDTVSEVGDWSDSVQIYPNWNPNAPTRCRALEELLVSGVESDQGCSGWQVFTVNGADQECTITNTAFFEGIPTLSQYGMALMALLMLGFGAIGIRRFV